MLALVTADLLKSGFSSSWEIEYRSPAPAPRRPLG